MQQSACTESAGVPSGGYLDRFATAQST